jgi:hypothetical protein
VIEEACCLKNLRDSAERIVPRIDFGDRWLVTKFREESILQFRGDAIASRVFDQGFCSARIKAHPF